MKTSHPFLVLAGVCSGLLLMAAEPPPGAPAVSTNASVVAAPLPAEAGAPSTNAAPAVAPGATNSEPPITVQDGAGGLLFNFHGAPLSLVLDYMSDAAGFIINNQADSLRGSVEVWSKKPITKDEAVELLDSVLRKNHYAVNRDGRILTIYSMDKAKTSSELPVHTVSNAEDVEPTDDMATWIIPVKYVSATQLKMNLQILLPLETELSVNESANSLVMVAPARDVRRALKIINALDTSMSVNAGIQVFRLHYADAKQLATEITTLFSPTTGGMGGMGRAMMFMNMMRGGGGGGGGPGGASANPAGTKVAATSDDYSNSLIVSAAPDVMKTIADMILQVDVPTTDITEVKIFQLKYADPNQMADQLALLFPDTSRTDNNANNFGFRFGGGPFGPRFGRGNQGATSNERDKKKSQVIAVPEPRTRSIMVSAASEMMPHIAEMVAKLDIDARHEVVKVFELANADPQDVQQILQDLFQRSGNIRANNNNRQSMLGTGNPLTQRQMQNQQNNSSSSAFGGNSRGGGGGGGGMGF